MLNVLIIVTVIVQNFWVETDFYFPSCTIFST